MEDFFDSFIDWEKFDATTTLSQRINGVTKESIAIEVELWERQIKLLDPMDFIVIKKEINEWMIEIPHVSALTFNNIAATYSRLVNYKTRISKLIADAKAWKETCDSAIKYLEDLSPGAFSGTGPDKKAGASGVTQPFVHLKNQAARVENYLVQINGAIVFCAQQLDLLIKERQSRSKLNLKLGHQGEEVLANSFNDPPEEVVEEIVDEDGEIFQTVNKKTR